ncbi:MAG: DUF4386 domain-containing protein [Marinilabiliales bacterium]|nr:MAG: DUF4386 domain-containing protein [Marinilabiliales bacterium]
MNSTTKKRRYPDISRGNAAIIGGLALLIMAIIAPIADLSIFQKLIVNGDAAKTVMNIIASETSFRLGIFLFVIVLLLDIIVAWALYVFLKPINKSLSLLAAWLRIVYTAILGIAISYLFSVLNLLNAPDYINAFQNDQLNALVMISLKSFRSVWEFGLAIFGFHLLLVGYLVFKAAYMKKVLGILVIIAGLGYIIDSFGRLISTEYNITVGMFTFIGEVILLFWLLFKGRKEKQREKTKSSNSTLSTGH